MTTLRAYLDDLRSDLGWAIAQDTPVTGKTLCDWETQVIHALATLEKCATEQRVDRLGDEYPVRIVPELTPEQWDAANGWSTP